MWLQRKPCSVAEWPSAGRSACAWWWRWCEAHHSGPRCTAEAPSSANTNCAAREVRKARCEK